MRLSLQDLALRIKIMKIGSTSIEETLLNALDPPTPQNIQRAISALVEVKALTTSEEITPLGLHLAKLPMDVHLGLFLIMSCIFGCLDAALVIAVSTRHRMDPADRCLTPLLATAGHAQQQESVDHAVRSRERGRRRQAELQDGELGLLDDLQGVLLVARSLRQQLRARVLPSAYTFRYPRSFCKLKTLRRLCRRASSRSRTCSRSKNSASSSSPSCLTPVSSTSLMPSAASSPQLGTASRAPSSSAFLLSSTRPRAILEPSWSASPLRCTRSCSSSTRRTALSAHSPTRRLRRSTPQASTLAPVAVSTLVKGPASPLSSRPCTRRSFVRAVSLRLLVLYADSTYRRRVGIGLGRRASRLPPLRQCRLPGVFPPLHSHA